MMALQHSQKAVTLGWLLDGIQPIPVEVDCEIMDICLDSREVQRGDLFFAVPGIASSGDAYITEAVNRGAVAVLADDSFDISSHEIDVPVVMISRLNEKLGLLAHRYFQCPSEDMTIIGITGTNGKTSIAYLLTEVLAGEEKKLAASIGTLGIGMPGELATTRNTTPDAITIHRMLSDMHAQGVSSVTMEVSSHALSQYRVEGVNFDTGIFTNLSQDHLDYHGDMQSYANAKRRLFEMPGMRSAVINIDDEFGRQLANELDDRLQVFTYGLDTQSGNSAHLKGNIIENQLGQLLVEVDGPWGQASIHSPLSGRFNALNLMASFSALCITGLDAQQSATELARVQPVPGRMECFTAKDGRKIIVDYAHTPDALEKALQGLRQVHEGKVITVAGCGGDRDSAKRPLMGGVVEKYSDVCIFTNDNPRFEDPSQIINQMLGGTRYPEKVRIIMDRAEAIEQAINLAEPSSAVLVAGKGHETYQEIQGVRNPFSDRQLVRNLLGDAS